MRSMFPWFFFQASLERWRLPTLSYGGAFSGGTAKKLLPLLA